ncbi:IS1106 transposase [Neisseria animaloris]|uniref:IS1106 transposase n=1 Tax=Neisseria animaloris TaxID=326522 RepID=A0A3S4Y842_9NEIS|nr:IS1106 transposase [Neisseria animaloris]
MSTFFQQTIQAMIAKHIDRSPFIETGSSDRLTTQSNIT